MKTIPIYLLLLIFLGNFNTVSAQDEFYSTPKTAEIKVVSRDTINLDNYTTEQDCNEAVYKTESNAAVEVEAEEDNERLRQKRNLRAEIVAEIVVDAFINAVFIIAAFWQ